MILFREIFKEFKERPLQEKIKKQRVPDEDTPLTTEDLLYREDQEELPADKKIK